MKKLRSLKFVLLLVLTLPLVGCPPYAVTILVPSNGSNFEVGEEITFSGSARDLLEGELSGDSLVWTSDKDGEIGRGTEVKKTDLSEGTHEITLTATNSLGEKGTDTIAITIGGGIPTTTTTSTGTTTSIDTTTTTTSTQPGTGAIVLSIDSESDLLFYTIHEDGSVIYYHGFDTSSGMELTHVTSDDGTVVIFNEDLIPIQWITDNLTIVVYKENNEEPFDAHNAYHEVLYGTNEDSFTIDIYPDNLPQIVSDIEAYTGQKFDDASTFLTNYNISSFNELVNLAKQDGQEQVRFIAAAVGFSAAAAFLRIEAEGFGSEPFSSIIPLQYDYLVQFVVGLIASKFNDAFGPGGPDPDVLTVEVLLCRGVSSYIICHYMFFKRPGLEVGPCIDLCFTSMRCFTDICMPKTISAELAKNSRDNYFGGG